MPEKTAPKENEQNSPENEANKTFDSRRFIPAGLNLHGRRVLVVGNRKEVLPYIQSVIEFGASVDVVADTVPRELKDLVIAYSHRLSVLRSAIKDVIDGLIDLDVYFMVFAFSNSFEENKSLVRLAGQAGVLCMEPGLKQHSNFAIPTWFRRGHIKFAVATDGISGALERALINRIKAAFVKDMDRYALFADFVLERLRLAGARLGGDDEQSLNALSEKMFQSEDVCLALQRNNFTEATHLFEQELEEALSELIDTREVST